VDVTRLFIYFVLLEYAWRKLRNEELHNLYSSPNIITMLKSRRMRWGGHVARMGDTRFEHTILVGKPEGNRPLGRPRRKWVDNIKMDLREIEWDGMDWIDLAQNSNQWRVLVNTVLNLRVS
jgi:transcription termination factor 2